MPAVVGVLVTVLATGSLLDSSTWRAAVALVAVMLMGMGGASHLLRRPRWQLLAVYRGMDERSKRTGGEGRPASVSCTVLTSRVR